NYKDPTFARSLYILLTSLICGVLYSLRGQSAEQEDDIGESTRFSTRRAASTISLPPWGEALATDIISHRDDLLLHVALYD
ncbi:hypothetical protein V3C99_015135, partial [Haemonchus contortus]|uniref:MFS transporter n=1 Tax=Haemonchus contortus TaxID=6289 RepID=A0A7I4YUV3_HAECO